MNKWMHTFIINRTEETQTQEKSKNEKGEEITTIKKESKENPITLKIKKPNRRLYDDADLFYGVKLSEGIKAGLLTKTLLAKRYDNDGGPMSNPEKEKYAKLYIDLYEKENVIQKLQLNLDEFSEEEKREKLTEAIIDMSTIKQELHQFELSQQSLFDQTAEVRARNQTIMWWVLNLSYMGEEKGEEEMFFPGDSFDNKLDTYDELEEKENPFWADAIRKFIYFISFWESGQVTNEEEFKEAEKVFERTLKENEEVPEENEEEDKAELKTAYEKAEEQEKAEEKAKEKAEKQEPTKPKKKAKKKELATENA